MRMDRPRKDIMAPDNEPTDEELAVVMREARDVARQRRAQAMERLHQQVEEAVREALARPRSTGER